MAVHASIHPEVVVGEPAGGGTSILGLIQAALDFLQRRHERRRAARHLHAMPTYLLKDIGISRADIRQAVDFGRPSVRDDA